MNDSVVLIRFLSFATLKCLPPVNAARLVVEITGLSRLSINTAVNRFKVTGSYDRRPGSGRLRMMDKRIPYT